MFYRLGKKSKKPQGVATTSLPPTPALYAQGLTEVEFPIFSYNYSWTLVSGRLIEGCLLIDAHLMEVQL